MSQCFFSLIMFFKCLCFLALFFLSHRNDICDKCPNGELTMDIQQCPPCWLSSLVATRDYAIAPEPGSIVLLIIMYVYIVGRLVSQVFYCTIKLSFFFLAHCTYCIPGHGSPHHHCHNKSIVILCCRQTLFQKTLAPLIVHPYDPP